METWNFHHIIWEMQKSLVVYPLKRLNSEHPKCVNPNIYERTSKTHPFNCLVTAYQLLDWLQSFLRFFVILYHLQYLYHERIIVQSREPVLSEKSSPPGKSGNAPCCERTLVWGEFWAVAIKHLV